MKDNNTKEVTGHLKNIWFASPDQLFFWTKKTLKIWVGELENSNTAAFENYRIM